MATVLFEGVFEQILLKTAKMTFLTHFFKLAPLLPPHFEDNWISELSTYFLFIELGLTKRWLVLVHSKQSYV